MQRSMIMGRSPRGLALLLAFLVLFTGSLAAGAHHDHDSGHHAGCPSCRLADGSAGTLPTPETGHHVYAAIDLLRPIVTELVPTTLFACNAHRLRAPPTPPDRTPRDPSVPIRHDHDRLRKNCFRTP